MLAKHLSNLSGWGTETFTLDLICRQGKSAQVKTGQILDSVISLNQCSGRLCLEGGNPNTALNTAPNTKLNR